MMKNQLKQEINTQKEQENERLCEKRTNESDQLESTLKKQESQSNLMEILNTLKFINLNKDQNKMQTLSNFYDHNIKNQTYLPLKQQFHTNSQTTKRMSSRFQTKPIQFWQNQKILYHKRAVVGIQKTINLQEFIQSNFQKPIICKIYFDRNEIETKLILRRKNKWRVEGFSQNYSLLTIEVLTKASNSRLYLNIDNIQEIEMNAGLCHQILQKQKFCITNLGPSCQSIRFKLK